jgi:hypothetical protein
LWDIARQDHEQQRGKAKGEYYENLYIDCDNAATLTSKRWKNSQDFEHLVGIWNCNTVPGWKIMHTRKNKPVAKRTDPADYLFFSSLQ